MDAVITEAPWEQRTSWAALSDEVPAGGEAHIEAGERMPHVVGRFVLGRPDDQDAPIVFRTYFPPDQVTPVHSHRVNYSEWIIDGSREITRKWYREGDIQAATAGTFYGPLIAGPAGVLVLAIFATQDYNPITVEQGRAPDAPKGKKYFSKTSWDELHRGADPVTDGAVRASYVVGEPDDPSSPVVMKTFLPPRKTVDAHVHDSTFAHLIIDGVLTDGDTEYRAGDIRIGTPGIVHGPLVAGPMGVNMFSIFSDGHWDPVPC
jgi:quercetin dioxygenase-like cupin family protein